MFKKSKEKLKKGKKFCIHFYMVDRVGENGNTVLKCMNCESERYE